MIIETLSRQKNDNQWLVYGCHFCLLCLLMFDFFDNYEIRNITFPRKKRLLVLPSTGGEGYGYIKLNYIFCSFTAFFVPAFLETAVLVFTFNV